MPGDILCLFGDLGTGKTVLVKGIAAGLGGQDKEVISPSYVLIRQYAKTKVPLYHFDLYRLDACSEIVFLGYEEYLYSGAISVIEWADRLKHLMPQQYLKIRLTIGPGCARRLKFSAKGTRYKELLKRINEDLKP